MPCDGTVNIGQLAAGRSSAYKT